MNVLKKLLSVSALAASLLLASCGGGSSSGGGVKPNPPHPTPTSQYGTIEVDEVAS